MGADKGTAAALDADIGIPDGISNATLRFSHWVVAEGRCRQQASHSPSRHPLPGNDLADDIANVFRRFGGDWRLHGDGAGDLFGNGNLVQMSQGIVDSSVVLLDDRFTALTVGFLNRFLDLSNGLFFGQNAADGEETGLHDRIDPLSMSVFRATRTHQSRKI